MSAASRALALNLALPLALTLAAGLGGCTLLFDVTECASDGDCPDGRSCSDGLCRLSGGGVRGAVGLDAAPEPTSDAGDAGDAGPPARDVSDTGREDEPRPPAPDGDGDGFDEVEDCDDTDATIHPGGLDLCGDGTDGDCSRQADAPCAVIDTRQQGFNAESMLARGDGFFVGFNAVLEGFETQIRQYTGSELGLARPLPDVRSIHAMVATRGPDGGLLWLADPVLNRLWTLPDPPDFETDPVEFRIDGGRPLAPADLAHLPAEDPADDLILICGQVGEAAWTLASSGISSGSLAGIPNPCRLETSADRSTVLVASRDDSTLRIVGVDNFGEPEIRDSLVLPEVPRDLAVLPRRAVVLGATAVHEIDLDLGEPDREPVPVPEGSFRVAVDPGLAYIYVIEREGGMLHVIDRRGGEGALVRQVDLTRAAGREEVIDAVATDLVVAGGKVYVALAGRRAEPTDLADSLVMVVAP